MRKPNDADSSQFPYQGDAGPTSSGLIAGVKEGETEAWDRFVRLYTPLIRYWCLKPGGGLLTRQDRQDIAQEVLRKVSLAVDGFDEKRAGRSLRAWLRTITQNTIADHLEFAAKRKAVNRLASDTGHFKFDKPVELEEEPEKERIVLLRQVMEIVQPLFSERDWAIVNLFVNAEKTSKQVAEILDMKPDSVRKIKNRVLARIRREYEALDLADEIPEL